MVINFRILVIFVFHRVNSNGFGKSSDDANHKFRSQKSYPKPYFHITVKLIKSLKKTELKKQITEKRHDEAEQKM